jgi:small-conductance mechanosensitive channel
MLSLQIIQMGMRGLFLVLLSLFPQFILYGMSLILLIKRNFQEEKKEEMLYETSSSFLLRYSILFEIIFIILGCILESFINPSIMSGMLKLWK